MIISRTPLRVSFIGGGSDLPSYYLNYGGRVVSMAINRYVYVSVNKSFGTAVRVAYSKVENKPSFADLDHPLVRNSAKLLRLENGLEISSTADIPANGTGLGSSSSFTVGLLNALSTYKRDIRAKEELAKLACEVEIDLCNEPIGKQDQYAAALGGFNSIEFNKDETVSYKRIDFEPFVEEQFLKSVLIFYTGVTRTASSVLSDQRKNILTGTKDNILSKMVSLTQPFIDAINAGDILSCGNILEENWVLKKSLSAHITNPSIDDIYLEARAAGAIGGKLLGAGAGGFVLFIAPQEKHCEITKRLSKLKQQFWGIDRTGTAIIYQN